MKQIHLHWSLSFLILGASACGPKIEKASEAPLIPNLDLKSCSYNVGDGDKANFNMLQDREILSVSFGKEFNYSLFKGIASASILSSLEYINLADVIVYKAPPVITTACSRPLFSSAETLPTDLQDTWDSAGGSVSQGKIMLGLYLSEGLYSLPSLISKAAIILRENTSRWTLVHEFMHHLFQTRLTEKGVDLERATIDYKIADRKWDKIEQSNASFNDQIREKYPILITLIDQGDIVMTNYYLEEIAVEKFMKEKLATGMLKNIPEDSNWYIQESAKVAIIEYENWQRLALQMQEAAGLLDIENGEQEMSKRLSIINARLTEIRKIQRAYPDTKTQSLQAPSALTLYEKSIPTEVGCSRDHEMQELMNIIQRNKNRSVF